MLFKIFKMLATSGFLTALECTDFVFGRGFDPTGGAYSAPPDPLAGLKGTYLGEERGKRRGGEQKGSREKGKGRGKGVRRGGDAPSPLTQIPGSAPATYMSYIIIHPQTL